MTRTADNIQIVGFGRRTLRRDPAPARRSFTVALVGADGAGKSAVARELEKMLQLPARSVYMGANPEAATHLLPTTRVMRAVRRWRGTARTGDFPGEVDSRPRSRMRAALESAHTAAWLTNRVVEEWYRQLVVWRHLAAGRIVILDRHYYADYHASDVAAGAARPVGRRVHGFLLARFYPKPDLVIFLDAPPAVLLARKGEGTIEYLEERRADYLALQGSLRRFVVVDATQPLEVVSRRVTEVVVGFARTGGTTLPQASSAGR